MKKSKIFTTFLTFAVFAGGFAPFQAVKTHAQTLDEADRQLTEFIAQDFPDDVSVRFSHTPLYDENLTESGRAYEFTVGEQSGYALMKAFAVGDKTVYEIEELFYGKASPFEDCDGLPIYVARNVYLSYQDDAFYNVENGAALTDGQVEELAAAGFGYMGNIGSFETVTQTIAYATKDTSVSYSITRDLPNYGGTLQSTGCANTAGAILVGYYDRFCENLIPDFQVYTQFGATVIYKGLTAEVSAVIEDLFDYMGSSATAGTTFAGFQSGMTVYARDHGYTYSTTNVLTSGSFDFAKYKASVEANKPVALFLSGFAYRMSITESNGVDTITNDYNALGTHVVIGCGYQQHTYYNASGGKIGTRTYLKIATGMIEYGIGYLNINGYGNIDHAISVTIS